jgi:hypothetical protein
MRFGVGEQPLPGGDVGELNLGGLVLRLQLEDLPVEGRGFGIEAFVDEVLGDTGILTDRLLRLASARVGSPRVLAVSSRGNSSTTRRYSAIAGSRRPCRSSFSAFFSVASRSKANGCLHGPESCGSAMTCTPTRQAILSKSDGGRNVRRCSSE